MSGTGPNMSAADVSAGLARRLFPALARLVVPTPLELVRQVVDVEPGVVVVRIDVPLAVTEAAAVVRSVAQRSRRPDVAVLAHVGGRALQCQVARVRLRRPC